MHMKIYTESQVLQVLRGQIVFGTTQAMLADKYNVARPTMCDIINGKRTIPERVLRDLGFQRLDHYYARLVNRKPKEPAK